MSSTSSTSIGNQVSPIDLKYRDTPEAAAAFLIRTSEGPVLVECGPGSSSQALHQGLSQHGVDPDEVKHVFLTHIHLDHAGATGEWTNRGARIYVHPRGARHLVDPTQLMSSATRIYGAALDTLLGPLEPSPEELIQPVEDQERITIGDAVFQAIETPGHARHHHCWLLEIDQTRHLFTGDTIGMRLPSTEFALLPLVPPELNPEAWSNSIERVRSLKADAIWLTHFGLLGDHDPFLDQVQARLHEECAFVRTLLEKDPPLSQEDRMTAYHAWQVDQGRPYGATAEMIDRICDHFHYEANLNGVTRLIS